jgi:hypothetical protein
MKPLQQHNHTSTELCQVCSAVEAVASRLVGKEIESLFADMGAAWTYLMADPQLRWLVQRSFRGNHVIILAFKDWSGEGSYSYRLWGCRQCPLGPIRAGEGQALMEAHRRFYASESRECNINTHLMLTSHSGRICKSDRLPVHHRRNYTRGSVSDVEREASHQGRTRN